MIALPFGRGSLRLNLMAWLIVPGAAILGLSVFLSYGSAVSQATLVTDRQLISSARIIAEQINYGDDGLAAIIPPSALELFASDSHDEIAYAILGPNRELIAGYPGLKQPEELPPDLGFRAFETMFRDEAMRATILQQPVITPNGTVSVSVMVGETLKARDQLVRSLWIRGFLEQALLVLAVSLSIWIGIKRELRPLLQLRRAVIARPVDRFDPFDATAVQAELRPLVLALNSHMQRLEQQLARQRRFLDSAAHQLRTPLALMKTQIGYARRTGDGVEIAAALGEIDTNLTAVSRLTRQLLTLGRVDSDRSSLKLETIDLAEVVRDCVAEAAPRMLDAGQSLGFDADGQCDVAASAMLVREIVGNLLDNCMAHAGAGATVRVSVRRDGASAVLAVDDDGAGIAKEDRPRLFERFRRGRAARSAGSGLGLSIVAEITEIFGGTVELPTPVGGRGFGVAVRLPLVGPALALPATTT